MFYYEHLVLGNFRVNRHTYIQVLLTLLDFLTHVLKGEEACEVSWEWSERQAITTKLFLGEAVGKKSTCCHSQSSLSLHPALHRDIKAKH